MSSISLLYLVSQTVSSQKITTFHVEMIQAHIIFLTVTFNILTWYTRTQNHVSLGNLIFEGFVKPEVLCPCASGFSPGVLSPRFNTGYLFDGQKWCHLQTHSVHLETDLRNGVTEPVGVKYLTMLATLKTVCFPFVGFSHKIVKGSVFVLYFFMPSEKVSCTNICLFFPPVFLNIKPIVLDAVKEYSRSWCFCWLSSLRTQGDEGRREGNGLADGGIEKEWEMDREAFRTEKGDGCVPGAIQNPAALVASGWGGL